MLKKRLIFTLLFDGSDFVLSRNFRLQKVGDLSWLQKNYVFENTARSIDELVVLNVKRGQPDNETFAEVLKALTKGCFVPVSAGGGVRSMEDAGLLLRSGADKIVLNTSLISNLDVLKSISNKYGKQCIIASIDIKRDSSGRYVQYIGSGTTVSLEDPIALLDRMKDGPFGEVYINSIDRDGTGQGYDMGILDLLPEGFTKPVILAGGVGNSDHLNIGLRDTRVDAVATAHLFNFVGNGLDAARKRLQSIGHKFPTWDYSDLA